MSTQTCEDTMVLEEVQIKEPSTYQVVFLNDDKTHIEFVVDVLASVFHKTLVDAEIVTLQIHHTGRGIAGVYSEEIAETKQEETTKLARANGFPLQVVVEEV